MTDVQVRRSPHAVSKPFLKNIEILGPEDFAGPGAITHLGLFYNDNLLARWGDVDYFEPVSRDALIFSERTFSGALIGAVLLGPVGLVAGGVAGSIDSRVVLFSLKNEVEVLVRGGAAMWEKLLGTTL